MNKSRRSQSSSARESAQVATQAEITIFLLQAYVHRWGCWTNLQHARREMEILHYSGLTCAHACVQIHLTVILLVTWWKVCTGCWCNALGKDLKHWGIMSTSLIILTSQQMEASFVRWTKMKPSESKQSADRAMVVYKDPCAGNLTKDVSNKPDKWGLKICR